MFMGLDTGGNMTKFGKVMTSNFDGLQKTTITSGAAGGSREEDCLIIPKMEINIGNGSVLLTNTKILKDMENTKSGFFVTPGILGIDIAQRSTLIIDYFNRYISV